MGKNRIYGEKIDIDAQRVREFYEKRAKKAAGDNPYSAVLLSDHSPELVEEQMRIDKEILLPKIKLDAQSRVLDIGCGIGRWAQEAIPVCERYYGVDFSKNMIDTAVGRTAHLGGRDVRFGNMSFQELVKTNPDKKYNRVIISGILVYICDDDVSTCLDGLSKFLDEKSVVFIWEPCGVGQRLTLKDLPSEALNDEYSVIYRTKSEYDVFFKAFTENGFSVTFCEYYSALGGTVTFTDSDKIYYILERNG